MKIAPISFKSTYIIDSKQNKNKNAFNNRTKLNIDAPVQIYTWKNYDNSYFMTGIVAPECYDKTIEKYLNNNKLIYTKKSQSELLKEDSRSKILGGQCCNGFFFKYILQPFEIETEKLKNSQRISLKNGNNNSYYDSSLDYLKSGLPVRIPAIKVKNNNGKPDICFENGFNLYKIMCNLGFKTIPVSMSMRSFAAAYETGLIKDNC